MSHNRKELVKRIKELDSQGFGKTLKLESQQIQELENPMGNWGPGGSATSVSATVKRGLEWLKGNGDGGDDLEYEVDEPLDETLENKEESTMSTVEASEYDSSEEPDLLIKSGEKDVKKKVDAIIDPIKEKFGNKFTLNLTKIDRSEIGFFLEWINHVTGANLKTLKQKSPDELTIVCGEMNESRKESKASEDIHETESISGVDQDDNASIITTNTLDASSSVPYLESVKTHAKTSHMISIVSQFNKGIKIPKKSGNKNITMKIGRDGITEEMILGILYKHENLSTVDVIKKILKKKANFKLINNMYAINNYQISEN